VEPNQRKGTQIGFKKSPNRLASLYKVGYVKSGSKYWFKTLFYRKQAV
jgi:hypothetical protein